MKKIFIIMLLLGKVVLGFTQNYFSVILDKDTLPDPAFAVTEHKGSYYFCGGRLQLDSLIYRELNYGKISSNGDSLWYKFRGGVVDTFGFDSIEQYQGHIILSETDTTLLIFGEYAAPHKSEWDLFVVRIDTNGVVLKDTFYNMPKDNVPHDAVHTSDGGYMVLATSKEILNDFNAPHLIKLDKNLNIEWENRYGLNGVDEWGGGIAECEDGGFLVAARQYNSNNIADNWLFKVDSIGNFLWDTTWGDPLNHESIPKMLKTSQQSYIFITRKSYWSSGWVRNIELYSFDENGYEIWNKIYQFPNNASLTIAAGGGIENIDGTLTFLGNSEHDSTGKAQVFVLTTTPRGDTLWTRHYTANPNYNNYAWGFTPSSFGGYVFAGSTVTNSQDAWIKKIDCMGCDSVLCYYPDSCYIYDCTQDYPPIANFTLAQDTFHYVSGDTISIKFTNNSTACSGYTWFINGDSFNLVSPTYRFTEPGSYEIILVGRNITCTDTVRATLHILDVTGVNEKLTMDNGKLRVAPNPFTNEFKVQSTKFKVSGKVGVRLYDLLGRVMDVEYQILNNDIVIDGSKLEKGIYILEIKVLPIGEDLGRGIIRTKIVKN